MGAKSPVKWCGKLGVPVQWLKAEADAGRVPHSPADKRYLFEVTIAADALAERIRAESRRLPMPDSRSRPLAAADPSQIRLPKVTPSNSEFWQRRGWIRRCPLSTTVKLTLFRPRRLFGIERIRVPIPNHTRQ